MSTGKKARQVIIQDSHCVSGLMRWQLIARSGQQFFWAGLQTAQGRWEPQKRWEEWITTINKSESGVTDNVRRKNKLIRHLTWVGVYSWLCSSFSQTASWVTKTVHFPYCITWTKDRFFFFSEIFETLFYSFLLSLWWVISACDENLRGLKPPLKSVLIHAVLSAESMLKPVWPSSQLAASKSMLSLNQVHYTHSDAGYMKLLFFLPPFLHFKWCTKQMVACGVAGEDESERISVIRFH